MRRRLAAAKGAGAGVWEVKDRTGGILDIELGAQAVALLAQIDDREPRAQLARAAETGDVSWEVARALVETHRLLCAVQQAQRLLVDGVFDPEKLGADGLRFVARFGGVEDYAALPDRIDAAVMEADGLLGRILTVE